MSFPIRLKELMLSENISKRMLATKIKVERKTVSNWLRGLFLPRVNVLCRLADFFNVGADYLLGRSDDYSRDAWDRVDEADIPRIFRTRLKNFINSKNFTEYRFSKEIKTEQSTLTKWLSSNMPDILSMFMIAYYFIGSVFYLVVSKN